MIHLEIYLEQYHRFSFSKICYIKQSLFPEKKKKEEILDP